MRSPGFLAVLGGVLAVLPAGHATPPDPLATPPPLKSLRLGADDVAVRIRYMTRRPSLEAWLTLQRISGTSSARYRLGTTQRDRTEALAPSPRVPWSELWQEMTETGFFSLPDENATEPCETEPIPVDAPRIAVEVRQGTHVHHFGYGAPLTRECPAAQRVASTLRYLQDVFDRTLLFP